MRTLRVAAFWVAGAVLATAPALMGAGIYDSFNYPAGPLVGNGPPAGYTGSPWPWATTGGPGDRIQCIGGTPSTGIAIFSDSNRTGVDDEAYLAPLGQGPGNITFKFDVKSVMPTQFAWDWWSITAYTDTDYALLRWSGRSNTITLLTPHGSFYDMILPYGTQMPVRADVNFTIGAMAYAFNGVRPAQHPTPPPNIATVGGTPLYAGYDDVFFNEPNVGTRIDRVEIISHGFTRGQVGPDANDLPFEHIYVNNLAIDETSNFGALGFRTPPSGLLIAVAGSYSTSIGSSLLLNAGNSLDEAATIQSYRWDLNEDGFFETDSGSSPTRMVDYGQLESMGLGIGTHTISLQVTDSAGNVDTVYTSLEITPEPATLSLLALGAMTMIRRRRPRAPQPTEA